MSTWMNRYEIARELDKYSEHPVLSKATEFLDNLREETDEHSDGWHSWPLPGRAASKLMALIQTGDATIAQYRAALSPIKRFFTTRGNKAGMKYPDDGLSAPSKVPAASAQPLEKYSLLVMSTAHVSKETAEQLTSDTSALPFTVWKSEYGWEIDTRLQTYQNDAKRDAEAAVEFDAILPPDLRSCVQFARRNGATYLRFDADATEYVGLLVYRW